MIKSSMLGGALLLTMSSAGQACQVPAIGTLENQTTTGHMYASPGKPCWIFFGSSTGPMNSVRVVQQPANGEAKVREQAVGYRSRPGFTGSDSFTYARHGLNTQGRPVVRTVNVIVSVK